VDFAPPQEQSLFLETRRPAVGDYLLSGDFYPASSQFISATKAVGAFNGVINALKSSFYHCHCRGPGT